MAWIQKRRELDKLSDLEVSYSEIEDEDDFQIIQPHIHKETDSLLSGDHNQYDFVEYHDDDEMTEDFTNLGGDNEYKIAALDVSTDSFSHKYTGAESPQSDGDNDEPVASDVKKSNIKITTSTKPAVSQPPLQQQQQQQQQQPREPSTNFQVRPPSTEQHRKQSGTQQSNFQVRPVQQPPLQQSPQQQPPLQQPIQQQQQQIPQQQISPVQKTLSQPIQTGNVPQQPVQQQQQSNYQTRPVQQTPLQQSPQQQQQTRNLPEPPSQQQQQLFTFPPVQQPPLQQHIQQQQQQQPRTTPDLPTRSDSFRNLSNEAKSPSDRPRSTSIRPLPVQPDTRAIMTPIQSNPTNNINNNNNSNISKDNALYDELEMLRKQVAALQIKNTELSQELVKQKQSTMKPISEQQDSFEDYFQVPSSPELQPAENELNEIVKRVKTGLFATDISHAFITRDTRTWFYNKTDEIYEIQEKTSSLRVSKSSDLYELSGTELNDERLQAWCNIRSLRSIEDKRSLLYACHYDRSKNYLNSNGDRNADNLKFPINYDAVIAVLLSIEQSVTFREFMRCMAGPENRVYLDAYIGYLRKLNDYDQLMKVYRFHSMHQHVFTLRLEMAIKLRDPKARLQEYDSIITTFRLRDANNPLADYVRRNDLFFIDYGIHITDAINLLSRQLRIEEHDRSVAAQGKELIYLEHPRYCIVDLSIADTLKYLLFYHPYADESKLSSPKGMAQIFRVTRHRYLYHAAVTRSRIRDWKAVEALFNTAVTENLCGMSSYEYANLKSSSTGFLKSKLSTRKYSLSVLSAASFVQLINLFGGPIQLLHFVIDKCPDPEEKYDLARKNRCYNVAVQCVITQLKNKDMAISLRREVVDVLGAQESQSLREQLDLFITKLEKKKSGGWLRKLF
jgi:hypothetical protein